jgi:hypothetical protein
MTHWEIAKQRLAVQQLSTTNFTKPTDLLRWFGVMQAQEYGPTKWSFGIRMPRLKDADVEKDFTSGKILRTHLLRPTWHFVAAEDIRWMLQLTKARVHAANAFMYRQLELEKKIFTKCTNIIVKSLEGKNQLTRDDLNEEFKKSRIKAEGHRLSYIMMHAELEGIICSGARQGNQFTYVLLDERIPVTKSKSMAEALAELTQRYFTSRGPATIQDFSTWSGLTIADCKKGIEFIKGKLLHETVGNELYYFAEYPKKYPKKRTSKSISIHLLPIYDEYIMGYKKREAILQVYQNIKPKPALGYDSTIVSDGQIIGTWRRVIKPKHIDLQHKPFHPFTALQKIEFKKAVDRYQKFTGLEVILQ